MKNLFIGILQFVFGYKKYLFLFSIIKIATLRFDKRKRDYLRFVRLIPGESNVLIIGANTGITSVPIARLLTTGKIFAFEPVQQNAEVLNRVLSFFKVSEKARVFRLALGNRKGKLKMILPVWGITKKHGFAHAIDEAGVKDEKGIHLECEVWPLDDLDELKTLKIDFMKIVAENYEYQIFSGGKKIIEKNKPVIYCELWDNEHRQKVLDLLTSYGYQIRVFRGETHHDYNPATDKEKYYLFFP